MPIYEYSCLECGKDHEIMQKITDEPLTACPACGGAMKKRISNTSFVLKGSGWYVTDYASSDRKKAQSSEKGDTGKKTTESKPEAKTESKSETKTESSSSDSKAA